MVSVDLPERGSDHNPHQKRNSPGPGSGLSWLSSSRICEASWESHTDWEALPAGQELSPSLFRSP